jgi:hypothetical protein
MNDITNIPLSSEHQVPVKQHTVSEIVGPPPEDGSSAAHHRIPISRLGEDQAGVDIDAIRERCDAGRVVPSLMAPTPPASIEEQPTGLPEFVDQALAQVTSLGLLEPERLRHLRSDIGVAAKLTKLPLSRLPCDPCLLRPILHRVLPARHRITGKRWSSIKSSLARVLKITGWLDPDDALKTRLGEQWQAGCDRLPYSGQKPAFAHFARFCQRQGIQPGDVSEETVEAFRHWRSQRTLDLNVTQCMTALRRLWNWNVRHHPDWPQHILQSPRDPRRYGLSASDVHPQLRADIEACCASMARFSPLDPRQTRRYSPTTIRQTRAILLQVAAILVRKGADLDSLQSMRDVLNPAAVRCVLEDHADRLGKGEGWAASSGNVAATLKRAARISAALSDTNMTEVERLCGMVKFPSPRLTRKARERLAQFDEPAVMRRYLRLTKECFAAADRMLRDGVAKRAARLDQRALALAILANKPLRREDLIELDLATDFQRDSKGRIVGLSIPGSKTKTGRDEEALFEAPLIKRLERHLKVYRPLLPHSDSTYLFPGKDDGHRSPATMSNQLKKLVQDQVGAEFNIHLTRHLAVTMLLEDDPQNMSVAQRLIGHAQLKTTERYYGQARTRGAQRKWAEVLSRKARQLESGQRP